ncbi:MAG TPA: hypothetical protein VF857_02875 [Spirochaetota bacterium]
MEISIRKITQQLRLKGPDLLTRPVGRRLYAKIAALTEKANAEEVVVLDCEGISVIDPSCVDELLVHIIRDSMRPEKPFFVRLKNITPAIDMNISMVFDSYTEFAGMRIGVITEDLVSRRGYYIGKVNEIEKELLAYLRVTKSASIDDIAEHMHCPRDGVERTLEDLYAIRLVRKELSSRRKGYVRV